MEKNPNESETSYELITNGVEHVYQIFITNCERDSNYSYNNALVGRQCKLDRHPRSLARKQIEHFVLQMLPYHHVIQIYKLVA